MWRGEDFLWPPALIRDEYFDDRCTVTAVYDKAEIVPWRYGVRLESLGSNQTSFVAIDFEPYRIQFYHNNLTESSLSMLKESLKMMFPRALPISNNSLPCIYTTWCRQRLSWTVDGPHVGRGGLFDFDGLSYNDSGLSFDIYKILMNVTTSQLPSASIDAAIAGYVDCDWAMHMFRVGLRSCLHGRLVALQEGNNKRRYWSCDGTRSEVKNIIKNIYSHLPLSFSLGHDTKDASSDAMSI